MNSNRPISTSLAVGLCSLSTLSYLGSIYVLKSTRIPSPSPSSTIHQEQEQVEQEEEPVTRNTPRIVKARLKAVSVSTLLSCTLVPLFIPHTRDPQRLLSALGLFSQRSPTQLAATLVLPLALTATLFAGSLLVEGLQEELPGQRGWSWTRAKAAVWDSWTGFRTFIIGPLTEELVFRSCIIAISHQARFSVSSIIFLSPIYFGFAHIHHAWEVYIAGGKTKDALVKGVLGCSFQFLYTTLFGWYASFLFMRAGSVIPPFLAHSFCNWMGLPPLVWAWQVFPEWKSVINLTYLTGIAGFVYGFWRWTDPALFGGSIYWQ
ncbi:Abi-domain-containing protein [Meredithblackwellia eburnea MCA 4105]